MKLVSSKKALLRSELKNYRWHGVNAVGKKVSGQHLALNENEIRAILTKQQIRITKIRAKSISLLDKLFHKVKAKDITLLTRQLATMLATGVPIVQALRLISDNQNKAEMKSILTQLTQEIESGSAIAKAMPKVSHHFEGLYSDLVATGEQSGRLSDIFERLADYREKSEQLKAKVVKALIYPSMVIVVALGVSYLMLTMVIPEFETMFQGFDAQLPWFTQQVLQLSHWVQQYSMIIVISIGSSASLLIIVYRHCQKLRYYASQFSLKLPIIGPILSKAAIARFSRTLATNFSAGIPIVNALQTSSRIAGNSYYQVAIEQVHQQTASGMPIYLAMRTSQAFPEMVLQMIMIGEESGKLDHMLNHIATVYEFDVDNSVDNLGRMLEPLIIVLLGGLVGALVVAMYLPIFNLMNVLG